MNVIIGALILKEIFGLTDEKMIGIDLIHDCIIKLSSSMATMMKHRDTLMNYLKDGCCEISNNAAERRAKVYATGRKNFLFHDTEDGAKASAVVLSIIGTAKMNHLNVYQYLYLLLLYMLDYKDESAGIEQLLPWSEFLKEHCSGVMDTEIEQIADDLEDTVENIARICDVANGFAPDYDIEKICMTLQKTDEIQMKQIVDE